MTPQPRPRRANRGEEIKMRKEFIEVEKRKEAIVQAPWAAIIAKAEGGYWAFESLVDYRIWKSQK